MNKECICLSRHIQHLGDDSSLGLQTSLENYGLGLENYGLCLGLGLEGSGLVNIPG